MVEVPYIKCPVCGQEYHPSEIFIPDEFFGHPDEIVKDDTGKVDFVLGKDMSFDEEYVCDNCNTKMKLHAILSFETEVDKQEEVDFEEEYTSTFVKPAKIKLDEETLF